MFFSVITKNLNWETLIIQLLLKDQILILWGVHWEIRGVGPKKAIYRGELPTKRGGLEQFVGLRNGGGRGPGKKEGGWWYPNANYHPYCPISRKGNKTMKFGQVLEHNKRNIFLQKLLREWNRETSSRRLFVF